MTCLRSNICTITSLGILGGQADPLPSQKPLPHEHRVSETFLNVYESAEYRVTAIVLDTAQYKLFRPVHSDLLSTDAKTHFIILDFINKGINAVNLPSILRSKSVTETVPTYFNKKEPPVISYTYTKTIASKIFNFSSTPLDLDYHQFHNNPSPGECNTSSHLYQPYGHVITGDLSIIPNSKLRDLIAKDPKYREPCKVDRDKNLSLLCEAVDQYALQWAKWEIAELSVPSSWKEMLKGQIEERISKLKQNFKQPTGKVLQNVDIKACLSLTYIINMFLYQQIKLQKIS